MSEREENPVLHLPMRFRRTAEGLHLPEDLTRAPRSGGLHWMKVFLTWAELFGERPTADMIKGRLGRYGLGQVLETLGNISAVLHTFDPWRSVEGQRHILAGLFGPAAPALADRVQRWWDQAKETGLRHPPALFHELQIVCAAKLSLLELPLRPGERRASLAELGEALLMINDLLDEKDSLPADPSRAEERDVWRGYFTRNLLFHSADTLPHALARTHDLYLTDRPALRDRHAYVDLPELARSITGLDPEELWTLRFGIAARWLKADPSEGGLPKPIDIGSYLSTNLDYSPEESRIFFEDLACSVGEARRRLADRGCGLDRLRPFDPLPFAEKPLVTLDDRAYCVSVRLLLRKLTRGLHFLFLNGIEDENQRARYLTHMGHAFEDYVDGLLSDVYLDRYLDADTLDLGDGSKACDGLLDYGDVAVLIETKATLLPLDVWAEGDPGGLRAKIAHMFGRAADQIGDTIKRIENGVYAPRGLKPGRFRAYLPLVVTLETLPVNALLYELIEDEVGQRGALTHPKTRPLQVVDISDLEHLTYGVEQGFNLGGFLERRLAEDAYREDSVGNQLLAQRADFLRDGNPRLLARFRELADKGVDLVRARDREL